MHSVEQFVSHTHGLNGQKMPVVSIGIASAKEILSRVEPDAMRELARVVRQCYLPAVMTEIETLHAANAAEPETTATRAFLFGIATPNVDEQVSIAWALAAAPFYETLTPMDVAHVQYVSPFTGNTCKLGLFKKRAEAIEDARAMFPDSLRVSAHELHPVRGIGPKVAAMIAAVTRPYDRSFTVDRWHLRQLLWAAGIEYRVDVSVPKAAYSLIEDYFLEWCDEYFPHLPYFAVQWATWNAANGQHESHQALWADLIP